MEAGRDGSGAKGICPILCVFCSKTVFILVNLVVAPLTFFDVGIRNERSNIEQNDFIVLFQKFH